MALLDLWKADRSQFDEKKVHQVIAFAGSGRLLDGSGASGEFREFLKHVGSPHLVRYADECLTTKFEDSGLALQDVVNELGRRLGFDVTPGRYRGTSGHVGFDGIWKFTEGQSMVVEVKTTDAYRMDLNVFADYRRALAASTRRWTGSSRSPFRPLKNFGAMRSSNKRRKPQTNNPRVRDSSRQIP